MARFACHRKNRNIICPHAPIAAVPMGSITSQVCFTLLFQRIVSLNVFFARLSTKFFVIWFPAKTIGASEREKRDRIASRSMDISKIKIPSPSAYDHLPLSSSVSVRPILDTSGRFDLEVHDGEKRMKHTRNVFTSSQSHTTTHAVRRTIPRQSDRRWEAGETGKGS